MKKVLSTLLSTLLALPILAQSNGLNPILNVKVNQLEYVQPEVQQQPKKQEKELSIGDILVTVKKSIEGKSPDAHHASMAPFVNAVVKSALGRVYRFRIVDALGQGKENYILSGTISRLSTTSQRKVHEKKNSKGKIIKEVVMVYEGHVAVELVLTNLNTGYVLTQNFGATSEYNGEFSSPEKALSCAIKNLSSRIYDYYDHVYPIRANILEIAEETKSKVKELYIDVGSSIGVFEGERFEVFELKSIAGREVKNKIGRIKIEQVSGSDISLCKVQRGSKDIKNAIDEKKSLQVILE